MALSLRTCACACILAFLPGPLRAQGQEVRLALPDTSPFQPLPLRSPNAYRTAAGTPGPLYWQQRVDYSIQAELDTATHRIRGMEIITYTNHSPDTLRYLWIQLDQNLGSADNPLRMLSQRYEDEEGFIGGYTVDVVAEASAVEPEKQALARPLPHRVDGTLMQVMLNEPLAPGEATRVEIGWDFQVPLFWRTSRQRVDQGWLYEVGQWFPRLCVYDDARGWNTEPYTGHGEFYLEYGDIDRGSEKRGPGASGPRASGTWPGRRPRTLSGTRRDGTGF